MTVEELIHDLRQARREAGPDAEVFLLDGPPELEGSWHRPFASVCWSGERDAVTLEPADEGA